LDQDSTLIAVTEMGQSRGLVGGLVSGLAREPQKTPTPDAPALFAVPHRWREEAAKAGPRIERICVAYEAAEIAFS
jgi:transposase